MHVRILMSTRDGGTWLQAQLDSFLAQTHDDWSLWVSDDGSSDRTRDILSRFAAAHPGRLAALVDGPRRGSAANFLSLLCHPDLPESCVALSDQDDVWLPGKLARAVAHLAPGAGQDTGQDTGPDTDPAGYAARSHFTDERLNRRRMSPLWTQGPSFGNALVQNVMSGHSTVLNAAAHRIVRKAGAQPVPHHDWWLYMLLCGVGARVHLDPVPVLDYRQHATNVMGSRAGARAKLARIGMLRQRRLADWIAANCDALERASDLLTPEALRTLALFRSTRALPARHRPTALRNAGVRRQDPVETRFLYGLALLGRL